MPIRKIISFLISEPTLILDNHLLFTTGLQDVAITTAFIVLKKTESLILERILAQFLTLVVLEDNAQLLIVDKTGVLLTWSKMTVLAGYVTEWSTLNHRASFSWSYWNLAVCYGVLILKRGGLRVVRLLVVIERWLSKNWRFHIEI